MFRCTTVVLTNEEWQYAGEYYDFSPEVGRGCNAPKSWNPKPIFKSSKWHTKP